MLSPYGGSGKTTISKIIFEGRGSNAMIGYDFSTENNSFLDLLGVEVIKGESPEEGRLLGKLFNASKRYVEKSIVVDFSTYSGIKFIHSLSSADKDIFNGWLKDMGSPDLFFHYVVPSFSFSKIDYIFNVFDKLFFSKVTNPNICIWINNYQTQRKITDREVSSLSSSLSSSFLSLYINKIINFGDCDNYSKSSLEVFYPQMTFDYFFANVYRKEVSYVQDLKSIYFDCFDVERVQKINHKYESIAKEIVPISFDENKSSEEVGRLRDISSDTGDNHTDSSKEGEEEEYEIEEGLED